MGGRGEGSGEWGGSDDEGGEGDFCGDKEGDWVGDGSCKDSFLSFSLSEPLSLSELLSLAPLSTELVNKPLRDSYQYKCTGEGKIKGSSVIECNVCGCRMMVFEVQMTCALGVDVCV